MIVPQGKGMNNLESISYLKDLNGVTTKLVARDNSLGLATTCYKFSAKGQCSLFLLLLLLTTAGKGLVLEWA
jgi:hypothetical protein